MSDIEKTVGVGRVTSVNPGRPGGRRKTTAVPHRDRRSEPGRKRLPERGGEGHKVDDYA